MKNKGFIAQIALLGVAFVTVFLAVALPKETFLGGGNGTINQLQTYKVKVSANDTTQNYLGSKLVAGSNITITENNNGANETLTIAASGGGTVGPGTANEIAYFDTTTSIASLAVATYPSLTELSYVKGVTSAIQTQLNAKGTFTLPSLTSGSVLFSDGSTIAQDNANFFWDNTNNRLGILTATPTYSLEVAGTFKSGTGSVIGSPSAGGTSLTVRSSTGDPTTSVLAVNDESNNNLFRVHSEASGSTKMSTALVLIDNTLRVGDKLQIAGQLFSVRIDQVTPADSKLTVKAGDANYGDRGGGDLDFQSGAGAGAGDGGAISFYTSLGIASSGVTNTQIKRATITPSGSLEIFSTTSLLLGTAGSAVGNIGFRNGTSGTITLAPVTGALGTVTLSLPAATDTLVGKATTDTLTNKTLTSPAINAGTLTGIFTLGESTSIGLDPALTDQAWTGVTRTGVAGYAQAFGDLVYLSSVDSRWELADADDVTTSDRMLAMVVVAGGSDGADCTLLLQGNIRADSKFPTMTIGSAMYVGETAGTIQVAIPTGADNVIRRVGFGLTADELYFNPSMDSQVTVS